MSKSKTLNDNELLKLLAYIKTTKHPSRNRLLILFSYWCGMRVGEISNLQIHHVLNSDGSVKDEIHLKASETKGNRNRVVFIPEKLQMELENYFNKHSKHTSLNDYLFSPQGRKGKFSANSLTHRFKEFYIRCGIDNGSSHSGRRSFITNLSNKGINVRILQELVGHLNLSTTQRYIDINDGMKRRVIELI